MQLSVNVRSKYDVVINIKNMMSTKLPKDYLKLPTKW